MNMLNVVLAIALAVAFILTLIPQVRYARVIWDVVVFIVVLCLVLHVA